MNFKLRAFVGNIRIKSLELHAAHKRCLKWMKNFYFFFSWKWKRKTDVCRLRAFVMIVIRNTISHKLNDGWSDNKFIYLSHKHWVETQLSFKFQVVVAVVCSNLELFLNFTWISQVSSYLSLFRLEIVIIDGIKENLNAHLIFKIFFSVSRGYFICFYWDVAVR